MKQPVMTTILLYRRSHSEQIDVMQKTILWCNSFIPAMKIFESSTKAVRFLTLRAYSLQLCFKIVPLTRIFNYFHGNIL